MSALGIIVLVLSTLMGLIGFVNMGGKNTDKWFALAAFALCMAGLVAARWML